MRTLNNLIKRIKRWAIELHGIIWIRLVGALLIGFMIVYGLIGALAWWV
jgi:hypothetical protein